MEGRNAKTLGQFNVPHILERIFGYLDYESYKKCYEVNSTWHGLLKSEPYQKKAKAAFRQGILDDEKKLQAASKDGDTGEIKRLLSYGLLDVNKTGKEFGYAPLHDAVWGGHMDVVQMLIDGGAELNKGKTPLQENDWTPHGRTPLHIVAWTGNRDIAELLLERGADPKKGDNYGETPLDIARRHGHVDIVNMMEDLGGAESPAAAESPKAAVFLEAADSLDAETESTKFILTNQGITIRVHEFPRSP